MSKQNRLNRSFFTLKFSFQGLIKRFFSSKRLVSGSPKKTEIAQFYFYPSLLVSKIITSFAPRNVEEVSRLGRLSTSRVSKIQSIYKTPTLSMLINMLES